MSTLLSQTYLDYRTPAIEAGAVKDKGYWYMHGAHTDNPGYEFLQTLCRDHDIAPVVQTPPPTRTMAAIRKRHGKFVGNVTRSAKDHAIMRAVAYIRTMRGEKVEHSASAPYLNPNKFARWERTAEGELRIREVCVDKKWVKIPHWDFTPSITELEA